MCDGGASAALIIASVASAAVGVGTAIYSAKQAQKNSNAMAQMQQDEINAKASSDMEDRIRAARAARAEARVASAESGVSGNSVDAMMNDILFQSGRDVSKIEFNREHGIANSETERQIQNSTARANAAVQIANTAANTYGDVTQIRYNNAHNKYTINGG